MLKVGEFQPTCSYDDEHDVLYVSVGPKVQSYSIGNPAQASGVEWMVAVDDPECITGAIILDWKKDWVAKRMSPPLPFMLELK